MAIIEVVKWDADTNTKQALKKAQDETPIDQTYAWKFDGNELSTWTQLIVHESQEAVLFRGGLMDGPFGPGRHILKTENIPILSNYLNLPFGRSPFSAEVWFINKAIPLNVSWKTDSPIRLQDSKYGIVIPINAHGRYGVQIENSRKFLVKLVGTLNIFDKDYLTDYFQGLILTIVKTIIAKKMTGQNVVGEEGITILEIASHLEEISASIKYSLEEQLTEFGLKLVNFFVNHIDVDDDDQSIKKLQNALANVAQRNIEGISYVQERTFNTLEGASGFTGQDGNNKNQFQNNPSEGSLVGNIVGLGVGLGLGVPLGHEVGQQVSGIVGVKMNFSDKIENIERLGVLRDKGLITVEQFETERNKILNS
jgi:membrane protease subunit (stomatin/prohibitin family)